MQIILEKKTPKCIYREKRLTINSFHEKRKYMINIEPFPREILIYLYRKIYRPSNFYIYKYRCIYVYSWISTYHCRFIYFLYTFTDTIIFKAVFENVFLFKDVFVLFSERNVFVHHKYLIQISLLFKQPQPTTPSRILAFHFEIYFLQVEQL